MNVKTCKRCRRMFNYVVGPQICPDCQKKMEEEFQTVKKYIQEHPNCDIRTVAKECEVDPNQIRQWVKEERLEFTAAAIDLVCEKCGKPIVTGRFCVECKNSMANTLNDSIASSLKAQKQPEKPTAPAGNKMRFIKK